MQGAANTHTVTQNAVHRYSSGIAVYEYLASFLISFGDILQVYVALAAVVAVMQFQNKGEARKQIDHFDLDHFDHLFGGFISLKSAYIVLPRS